MKTLAGIFLCLMGVMFAAPAILGWIYLVAMMPLGFSQSSIDLFWFIFWFGAAFLAWFFFTMGHLMLCFSHGILREDESPFPSTRPAYWFTLRTLHLLFLSAVVGAVFGLFLILLGNAHRWVLVFGIHLISLFLLIVACRRVKTTIDEIEL